MGGGGRGWLGEAGNMRELTQFHCNAIRRGACGDEQDFGFTCFHRFISLMAK